jgi:hypothetical protein
MITITRQRQFVKRKRKDFTGGENGKVNKAELERMVAEERKAYFKAWRAANKEKTAEHRRRYWEKKALEKLNAAQGARQNEEEARWTLPGPGFLNPLRHF